jgi:ribosome biogenesis GTPase
LFLGRVIAQYKDLYKVATQNTDLIGEISGKLRYASDEISDYPAVGDFVMIDRKDELYGNAIIHHILKRKSVFIRRAAGTAHVVQVVASNVDTIFICISLNNDFNLRRLERYLAIAWDSGAKPVIVLTKSDLCDDLPTKLAEINETAMGVDLVITSSLTEDGYKAIQKYITKANQLLLWVHPVLVNQH